MSNFKEDAQQVIVRSIDIRKAENAPNHSYSFRLMFAMNDLLAIQELLRMLDIDRAASPQLAGIHSGIAGYLLRLQSSHIVEALDAFITKMPLRGQGSGTSAVAVVVSKHPDLKKLKSKLCDLMKTARYKQLEQVRHNFVFHYNHADQGAHTATALSTLVSELDTHDDFEVAGRILFEGSGRPSRFSVADKAMDVAWQSMFGFSPKVVESASENSSAVVSAFIFELGVTLIKFSDLWLTNWVAEHELQL